MLLTATAVIVLTLGSFVDGHDLRGAFNAFKMQYDRSYPSAGEEEYRFLVFTENMREAKRMHIMNPLAQFGVNSLSDVAPGELKSQREAESFVAAVRKRSMRRAVLRMGGSNNVTRIDWRARGAVTPVKNQLLCGGCWAFSATGNIEGQWAIAGHGLVSLSEQELISCASTARGCLNGNQDEAFDWLLNSTGGALTSEAQYPFVSGDGVVPGCDVGRRTAAAYIAGRVDVARNESDMAEFVATRGPLSILVDSTSFHTYKSGILTNCVSRHIDHAVLIVGYDLTAATPYWIVKNQWGTSWGEAGYVYLEYGTNQCLITTLPSSSVVDNPPPLPPPGSPAPLSPPATTNGSFTQYTCKSSTCADGCTSFTFANGKCRQLGASVSAMSSCGHTYLHLLIFRNSTNCTGTWGQSLVPLNQCTRQPDGSYVYDACTTDGVSKVGKLHSDTVDESLLTVEDVRHAMQLMRKSAAAEGS